MGKVLIHFMDDGHRLSLKQTAECDKMAMTAGFCLPVIPGDVRTQPEKARQLDALLRKT